MATSDPLANAAARPAAGRMLALSPAWLLAPRRVVHIAYFGFAIAALLVLSLLVPGQTTRAPLILAGGAAIWAAAAAARWSWQRRAADAAPLSIEPAHLFLVVLVSTYVVFAVDLSSATPQFSPATPDTLPGLLINSHAYFVLVFVYLLIFIGWYGSERGRLLETALAVQVFLLSLMFESFLAAGAAIPALALMALGLALLRVLPWEGVARPVDHAIMWLALPLGIFIGVAAIATALAVYPDASLNMTSRMAALAFFALLLFDAIREDRQRWLIWLALAAPAVTQGALVTLKVLDIARVMGVSFAFGDRIQLAADVDPNPLGLSLAIGILLIAAALPRIGITSLRWIAVVALAVLLPALVVAYSVPALMGLVCGLVALAILYALRCDWRAWRRPTTWLTPGSFILIGLVVAALYAVPAATRNGLLYTIDDPTTGRSRVNLWSWSVRDIKQHPLLGAGPGYYRGRTQYVEAEFPFRDVTKMLERRHLLGGDGSQWHVFVLSHPHSLILAVAEGMGIAGLVALAFVGAGTVAGAYRIIRWRDGEEWWLTSLALAIVAATFVWSLSALGFNLAILPLTGWLALGMVAIAHRTDHDRVLTMPRLISGDNARRALALSAGIAVLLLLVVRPVGSLVASKAGRDRFAQGNFSGAEAPLALAARFDPLDATAAQWVSFARLHEGDTNGALDALENASARLPDDPIVLAQLGDASWLAGHTDDAERYYRQSIAADRWQAAGHDTHTTLALLEISQGKRADALRTFADGFFVSPSNVYDPVWVHATDNSTVMLNDAFLHGGDPVADEGLSHALSQRFGVSESTEESPEGGTLSITSVFDVMEEQARAELVQRRERGIQVLYQLGVCYQNARLYSGARRVLSDAVTLDPTATYIRYALSQVELASGDDAAGIDDLNEVVRLAETSSTYDLRQAFAERDLALLALRQEHPADAITHMQNALADYRWAYLPFAYPILAIAYDAVGQHATADAYRDKERYLTRR